MFRTFWKFDGRRRYGSGPFAGLSPRQAWRLLMGTSTGGAPITFSRHMEQRAERQAPATRWISPSDRRSQTNIMLIENKEMDVLGMVDWVRHVETCTKAREKFLQKFQAMRSFIRCTPATSRFMPWRTPASRPSMISTASMCLFFRRFESFLAARAIIETLGQARQGQRDARQPAAQYPA